MAVPSFSKFCHLDRELYIQVLKEAQYLTGHTLQESKFGTSQRSNNSSWFRTEFYHGYGHKLAGALGVSVDDLMQ